jgi:hypothetical protein
MTRGLKDDMIPYRKVWEPEESKWEHDLFHLLESDEPLVCRFFFCRHLPYT